jgi:hypothetical protein
MPTERRRIIFSDNEVAAAVLSFCRATGVPVPDAKVERQSRNTENDFCLLLTFAVGSPDQIDELELDAETVLNALVSYCRMQSIPLPKAAAKRLERHDGALSMVFEMNRDRGSVSRTLAA